VDSSLESLIFLVGELYGSTVSIQFARVRATFFTAQTRKHLVVQDIFFFTGYSLFALSVAWWADYFMYVFLVHVLFSLFSSCVHSALLWLTFVSIIG